MTQIQITEIKTVNGRPYTLSISGYIGQSAFKGYYEGVNLVINETPYFALSEVQRITFEEKLQELIPLPYNGKYTKKEVSEAMRNGTLMFGV
ncbi:hypothetical protein CSV79_13890 [Sporosarcina sp. P13]|uniref:hypothetical protein n=1 Tax=Sporosarcina sp. P13 TaxID=2048263 RepID=UPI000C172451|nr:hypothetical protein [Sporosarcina sp. P13]PIC63045.1 hypothetical protein CSV79_13890 [Sporosarcina sp. P13]